MMIHNIIRLKKNYLKMDTPGPGNNFRNSPYPIPFNTRESYSEMLFVFTLP